MGGGADGLWMALGAVASAAAMLWYGLTIVREPSRSAGRLVVGLVVNVIPTAFGLYVVGWAGLKRLAATTSGLGVGVAILYVLLGVWVLRSWLRLREVRRLAEVMIPSHGIPGESTR